MELAGLKKLRKGLSVLLASHCGGPYAPYRDQGWENDKFKFNCSRGRYKSWISI